MRACRPDQMRTNRPKRCFCRPSPRVGLQARCFNGERPGWFSVGIPTQWLVRLADATTHRCPAGLCCAGSIARAHRPLACRAWLPSSTDVGPPARTSRSGTQTTRPTTTSMFRCGALPAPGCTSSIGKAEPSCRPPRERKIGFRARDLPLMGQHRSREVYFLELGFVVGTSPARPSFPLFAIEQPRRSGGKRNCDSTARPIF